MFEIRFQLTVQYKIAIKKFIQIEIESGEEEEKKNKREEDIN